MAFLAVLGACKENLSPPGNVGPGLDTLGPSVVLAPAHDTLVDSVGTMLVRVDASDKSGVKDMTFILLPTTINPPTVNGNDTILGAFFPVPLGAHKHGSFKYYVVATDILDHETVTDTVTVTVK